MLLFLDDATLRGRKLDVYVQMKILKTCTASKMTSYKCKYAVQDQLKNVDPDKMVLGEAIRKVMSYYTIRGKFTSVHKELQEKEGITRVEVMDEGFFFHKSPVRKLVAFFDNSTAGQPPSTEHSSILSVRNKQG